MNDVFDDDVFDEYIALAFHPMRSEEDEELLDIIWREMGDDDRENLRSTIHKTKLVRVPVEYRRFRLGLDGLIHEVAYVLNSGTWRTPQYTACMGLVRVGYYNMTDATVTTCLWCHAWRHGPPSPYMPKVYDDYNPEWFEEFT